MTVTVSVTATSCSSPSLTVRARTPGRHHTTMCLSRAADKINYQETDGMLEEISGSDHPSTEQFNMLLNLLPAHTLQQVRDMDSLRYLEKHHIPPPGLIGQLLALMRRIY